MRLIVIAIGLAAIGFAGVGLLQPTRLIGLVRDFWLKPGALYLAVALRAVLGVALIVVAPASRFPDVFYALGLLTLAAATLGLVVGTERLRRFLEWWIERPRSFLRAWLCLAVVFGAFLVYGVA